MSAIDSRPLLEKSGVAQGDGEAWSRVPIGKCCRAIRGVTFPSGEAKPDPFTGSIPCVTTSAVQDEVAWKSARHIPDHYVRGSDQRIQPGDLLVSTANSKALVGKLALASAPPEKVTFGAFVTVLRPLENILPVFLLHALRTGAARRYFFERSSETTNISNLRTEELLAFEIPLPPLAEQKRIARELTAAMEAVERARRAAQERLAAAEALPAALLREVFDGPQASGWETVRLGDFVSKIGSGITPSGGQAVYVDEGIPLIRSQNVHPMHFEPAGLAFITVEQDEAMRLSRVEPGDVLLNITGASIGRACVVPRERCPANVNQHVSIIRSEPDAFDSDFLCAFLCHPTFQRFIWESQAGATRPALTKEMIEQFQVPKPAIADQRRIAADLGHKLAAAEGVIARCREELAAIESLPAALLREAFGGNAATDGGD